MKIDQTRKIRFVVVDYKMGNLKSVVNAFTHLGCEAVISDRQEDILKADALILPGVGAFGIAMDNLKKQDLIGPLHDCVIAKKTPFLGICLGMQLVAEDSDEMGFSRGLGWIPGHVKRLTPVGGLRVPHVGWNTTTIARKDPLFQNMDAQSDFYFVHSFHFLCEPKYIAAECDYGSPVVAAIQHENIFATQFHPEKSQHSGLRVLRNFANYAAHYGSQPSEESAC